MAARAARCLLSDPAGRNPEIFRIQLEPTADGVRCHLAGRLDAESAQEARGVLAGCGRLRYAEVSEIGPVDEVGLALLADLRADRVTLEGLSPYLALRLAAAAGGARGSSGGDSAHGDGDCR